MFVKSQQSRVQAGQDAVIGNIIESRMRAIIAFWRWLRPLLQHRYLTFAMRIGLGGVFVIAGYGKLCGIDVFVEAVKLYDILPDSLSTAYGSTLPFVEFIVGVLLILGVFLRISAGVSILSTVSFVIAKSITLARGVNPPCCCLPWFEMLCSQSLAIDFLMLAAALQIMFHRGEFLALGTYISRGVKRIRKTPAEEP
jgi:uncharacterized membrane protein YphA (DoxX/SURF4 family)